LPSIGFLSKYSEPKPHENIRIDTGVQEGSEISMYYDPMISKLVTWGKDRNEALDLLDNAFDEYVVQGVAHNIGFGKSIVANQSFRDGDYSTAFIPDFYPEGYNGDDLTSKDKQVLALAAHQLKNEHSTYYTFGDAHRSTDIQDHTLFVTIVGKGEEADHDWKVVMHPGTNDFTITDLDNGESTTLDLTNFNFSRNTLVEMETNKGADNDIIQLMGSENDLKFNFYYQGGKVETYVYNENQFKYKQHMAPPTKIDFSKSILSPMPGAIVSVSVEVGQTVADG